MNAVMIIGGTDSSGGAGLTRDANVARELGFDVLPVVTAVTAQSNDAMYAALTVPPDLVAQQIQAALATTPPNAIKIGMLGSHNIAETVAAELAGLSCPIIIDPVLKSSSGGQLMSGQLPASLIALASLITPNLIEAAALSNHSVGDGDRQIEASAKWFLAQGVKAVLIKGGHGTGQTSDDYLITETKTQIFSAPRYEATLRGTGCALATAIACHLAEQGDLYAACRDAKAMVHDWLLAASRR